MTIHQKLASRIHEIARPSGTFTLRSGAISATCFDKYRFESDPVLLRAICEVLVELLPGDAEVLAGDALTLLTMADIEGADVE